MKSVHDIALELAEELRKQKKEFVHHYNCAVASFLRLCRLHGPFQAAAYLDLDIEGTSSDSTPSKIAFRDHLIKALGKQHAKLSPALSEETDSRRSLDEAFTLVFLSHCLSKKLFY